MDKKIANFAKFNNLKKIVVLNTRDAYSQSLTEAFIERALEYGLKIIYSNKFNPNEQNFNRILTDISPQTNKDINYDAIFIAGDDKDVPTFVKKARKYGIFAPILTGDWLDSQKILNAGKEMNGVIVSTIYNPAIKSKKMQQFIKEFKQKYNRIPDTWAVQGYDAIMLLAKAIEDTNSLDTKQIANKLKYMRNFKSIFGEYSLNTKGDVEDRDIFFKIVENGRFRYLSLKGKEYKITNSSKERVMISLYNWGDKLISDKLKDYGIIPEIITKAFAKENIKVGFNIYHYKKAFLLSKWGKICSTSLWFKVGNREEYFYYSNSLKLTAMYLFYNKNLYSDDTIKNDIQNYRVGGIRGYYYEKAIFKRNKTIHYTSFDDWNSLINALLLKKIDVIFAEKERFYKHLKGFLPSQKALIGVIQTPISTQKG